jgi:hypothetical protein
VGHHGHQAHIRVGLLRMHGVGQGHRAGMQAGTPQWGEMMTRSIQPRTPPPPPLPSLLWRSLTAGRRRK